LAIKKGLLDPENYPLLGRNNLTSRPRKKQSNLAKKSNNLEDLPPEEVKITRKQAEAALRNTSALAKKHEIEVEQLEGRLVELADVLKEIQNANTLVIQRLQSFPTTITPLLVRPGIKPYEIESILRDRLMDVLNELAYAKLKEIHEDPDPESPEEDTD